MSTQRWHDVAFVHWPADVESVRRLLPPSVAPDTLDGQTYVGLVAFRMDRVGLVGGPGVPYLGQFLETNVRLYSVDAQGRRGVVFLSMDASRLLPVLIGRQVFQLPYLWSRMRVARADDSISYSTRRRWPGRGQAESRFRVRIGARIDTPTALEQFLTARWGLHSSRNGRTSYTPIVHPPWPLHRAELVELDDTLMTAATSSQPTEPPASVLWSPTVAARFGWPIAVTP